MHDLSDLIAALRDFKPAAVAEQTGLSRQTVYNVLNGSEPNPKTDTVVRLHKFLHSQKVSIVRLLETEV